MCPASWAAHLAVISRGAEICYLIGMCRKRGYTTADERRRVTRMHDAYKARGGNHGEEIEYAEFLKLPTEENFRRMKGETE